MVAVVAGAVREAAAKGELIAQVRLLLPVVLGHDSPACGTLKRYLRTGMLGC
jgi:hypothetical protein